MGLKNVPARSTLSDALNLRDWRIYRGLAMRLITRARTLYAAEPLDIDLDATVYAIDASLYTLLQILSVSVFEETEISSALRLDPSGPDQPQPDNQMNLFDI